MSEYQTWPHGYVALPTVCASRVALRALREGSRALDELAIALRANRGQTERPADIDVRHVTREERRKENDRDENRCLHECVRQQP